MGRDKGSMKILNKPMIIHILEALNNQIDELVIVLNDENRIKKYKKIITQKNYSFKIYFTIDVENDLGPLCGIMTGLDNIHSDYALVLPCDSPYLDSDFVYYMFDTLESILENEENETLMALVPYHRSPKDVDIIKRAEPLHSIYHKSYIPLIEEFLQNNIRKVRVLMKNQNCLYMPIDNHLINEDNFKNLNRPTDIEE